MMRFARRALVVTAICAAIFLVATHASPVSTSVFSRAPAVPDVDRVCKGYYAKNVQKRADGLTAELRLLGEGCAVYGKDVQTLKLEVQYQESEYPPPRDVRRK